MDETRYPKPHWWLLFLTLPLAGLLFWLIRRAAPGGERGALEIGAVLVVFGYVELWQRANRLALMFQPIGYDSQEPLLEAPPLPDQVLLPCNAEPAPTHAFYGYFYSDLYNDVVTASVEFAGSQVTEGEPVTGGLV